MRFDRDLIPELVPDGDPPESLLALRIPAPDVPRGEPAESVFELAERLDDPLEKRTYLWTSALTIAGLLAPLKMPRRTSGYSAGFVHVGEGERERRPELRTVGGFALGLHTFVSTEEIGQSVFPFEVAGRTFPMVVNFGPYEEHGLPVHPGAGTGACWLKNNGIKPWSVGILTCRHTLHHLPLLTPVTLFPSSEYASPQQGRLADIDACTLDASVVEVPYGSLPGGLKPLRMARPVVAGRPVRFAGRSTTGHGTILRTFELDSYFGNLFGQRVFTDCFGAPGDSGSLYVDTRSDEGVGVYMGTVPDGSGGKEGVCQNLRQAARFFGFDAYL